MNVRCVGVYDKDGNTLGEWLSMTKAAKALNMSMSALYSRLNGRTKDNGLVYKYIEKPVKETDGKVDVGLKEYVNDGSCVEVPYETKDGVVCITPCKYKRTTFVASVLCKKCFSYRAIDREKKIVFCRNKGFGKNGI